MKWWSLRISRLEFKTSTRKITHRFRGICEIYLELLKRNWKITTWNQLDLGTPKISPDTASGHPNGGGEPTASYKMNQWSLRNNLLKCKTWEKNPDHYRESRKYITWEIHVITTSILLWDMGNTCYVDENCHVSLQNLWSGINGLLNMNVPLIHPTLKLDFLWICGRFISNERLD